MQRALVLELDVPSSPEFIAIVRLVVASVASARRALADERIDDLKLAVSEACTNAIEANRSVSPSAPVHVEIWESPDRLEVSIEDQGRDSTPTSWSSRRRSPTPSGSTSNGASGSP